MKARVPHPSPRPKSYLHDQINNPVVSLRIGSSTSGQAPVGKRMWRVQELRRLSMPSVPRTVPA